MDDSFDILLTYKGKELSFSASLVVTGYSYKIQVDVFGKIISFEPDEERNFRAVMAKGDIQDGANIDKALLEEIARTLTFITKA